LLHPGIAMSSDGQGGAIVTWDDLNLDHPQLMMQRLGAAGDLVWDPPIAVTQDPNWEKSPISISDGAGGAIIAWLDGRDAIPYTLGTYTIFAQRVDPSGNRLWNGDGVQVTPSFGGPQYYSMVSDGSGGAIIVWMGKLQSDADSAVLAQRFPQMESHNGAITALL
jgi:hypothetical protein